MRGQGGRGVRAGRPAGAALAAALLLAFAAPAWAARGADPDWPCPQRLVPTIAASALWSGPSPEDIGGWRAEPQVADLVRRIAPRRVPAAEGEAAIARFAGSLDAVARRRLLPLAFAGLLEETNRQRGELIEQIKRFTRRQRELAELAARLTAELEAMPAGAGGEAAERRTDLEQRRFFVTKAFEDAERTLRYMCEAPVQLEARLGAYVRGLEAALPPSP